MGEGIRSLPGRVAVAVLATAFALLLRLALWPVLGDTHPYLTFYPAVMIAGLLGGLLAGLTASALGAVAVAYFLVTPYYSLRIEGQAGLSAQAAFLVSGTLMSLLAEVVLQARRKAMECAAESQRLLAQLDEVLSHAPAGFAFFNDRLEVLRVNPSLAALTGRQCHDLIGRRVRDAIPLDGQRIEELVRRVFVTGKPVREQELSQPAPAGGVARSWVLELYPVRTVDRREGRLRPPTPPPVTWVALILLDISERKQLEEKLRRHANELAENDRRKDIFLAMLAHELRNPLAPLRTAVELLSLGQINPAEQGQWATLLQRQLHYLTRIIDDLLDTARISRGQIELRREPVVLADVIESAVQTVRGLVEERRQTLTVQLPATPVTLQADPVRLTQVLGNLLHNASRYTEPGGQIGLTVEQAGSEVILRISDTGIGIRPELLGEIFELFHRGDQVPGEMPAGLGLGLTLVRRLVELHGGQVTASSPGPGRGSVFEVRLPAETAQVPATKEEPPGLGTGAGVRVLVVDDNDDAAQSLALLLGIHGHDVRVAHDGPQALELIESWVPQVAFLDIGLPGGMDGYELARRLRAQCGSVAPRLIALTGFGQADDRRRGVEAGFDHYLVKPAGVEELAEVIGG
jgi:PAS domain S-box-containing protein